LSAIGGRKHGMDDSPEEPVTIAADKPYTMLCNNCIFWEVSDFGNIGICGFVAVQNKWAYLVHPGGRCLMTTFNFYCKGHEFRDDY